jgi:hypothetical protein
MVAFRGAVHGADKNRLQKRGVALRIPDKMTGMMAVFRLSTYPINKKEKTDEQQRQSS